MRTNLKAGREFARLVAIIGRLRSPGGCPWDRKQDVRSITDYFLEEAYETAEACLAGKAADAAEELGDMLMEVVFLSRLFEEKGGFTIADALNGINRKMTGRHPHVFGRAKAGNERQIVDEWQKTKLREKRPDLGPRRAPGQRPGASRGLPARPARGLRRFRLARRRRSLGEGP